MKQREISLKLTYQEALVLFEWIEKIESMDKAIYQHLSEMKVIWKLEGQLEYAIDELFSPDYLDVVAEARQVVASEWPAGGRSESSHEGGQK